MLPKSHEGGRKVDFIAGWLGVLWSAAILCGAMWLQSPWLFALAGGSFFVYFWLVLASTLGRDRIIFLFLVLNGIALLAEFTALVAFVVHLVHSDSSSSLEVLSTTESAVIHIAFVLLNLIFNTVVEYIVYGLYKFRSRGTKSTVSIMLNRY
ncbi:hypothetical protein AAVH_11336 [Aphelenchoides avenae]|nr:hypothetical protein AAVH_11336 [Aphelenchus avenae]